MCSTSQLYCRLCAEPKQDAMLLDLTIDDKKFKEMVKKLSYLNALYVDLYDETLDNTICFVCLESLENAYGFLFRVQQAQAILKQLVLRKTPKSDFSDDDRDDLPGSPEQENISIQIKSEPPKEIDFSYLASVKNEPKEELIPLNDVCTEKNLDDSLNVQELLAASVFDNPIATSTDSVWYTKKLSDNKSWKDYPWLCSDCKMEFPDLYILRTHAKEVHKKCFAFACGDCYAKPDNFEEFLAHARMHRRYLRLCCTYCDAVDENSIAAVNHLSEHFHRSEQACNLCGEILDSDALEKHTLQYSTLKSPKKPRRKRGVPITTEELTCQHCNKVYKNLNSLRDHSKLHTTERVRNYTCDRCGKAFYQKGALMTHLLVHDKMKPHVCKICNKSFLFQNMLRRHVDTHTGVKPFSCEQCGRCFRLLYQLKAHKIIHTDSMPYTCQYCNKSFRFKQIMKNHELQHTGAKPYMCQICSMEFTNWSNYNKHMKRRHGTDTSKKKITPEGVIPVNPETGQLIKIPHTLETEEWKTRIMLPCKRGKKKVIKQEDS